MKRQNQKSITSFFKKPKEELSANDDPVLAQAGTSNATSNLEQESSSAPAENVCDTDFDISTVVENLIDDNLKQYVLTSVCIPKQPFEYPATSFGSQKRRFQESWITKDGYGFLAYSKATDGVFCKLCLLFANRSIGKGGHEQVGKWVKGGFKDWKRAKEAFNAHSSCQYHQDSVVMAANFLRIKTGKAEDIVSQLDTEKSKQIAENRAALRPIIESVIFCARQEMPLRGDDDSGPLSIDEPCKKDGKFRALLRFRISSGDNDLRKHVVEGPRNAQYMSPDIQNDVIEACSRVVLVDIVSRVNSAEGFTVLADETQDVSGQEQLSICLRFVCSEKGVVTVREEFVGFIAVANQTAEHLADTIIKWCISIGLYMVKLVAQGYDGAPNMSGIVSGVQARIRALYPKARYYHCASHRLNLALSNSLSQAAVKNCLGTVAEVTNLFRNQQNASTVLKSTISERKPGLKKTRLQKLCETRFIERHSSVLDFLELFECICESLEIVAEKSWTISPKASVLLAAMEKSEFIVALVICERLLRMTLPLSTALQAKALDLISALAHADRIIAMFKEKRQDAESAFHEIFETATAIHRSVFNSELKVPRTVARQGNRDNHPAKTAEEYYRVAYYIPCVDAIISNLIHRFQENADVLPAFQLLLPGHTKPELSKEMDKLVEYLDETTTPSAVAGEYELWCRVAEKIDKESEVLEVIEQCNKTYFPNIHKLLTVLATLPVTTCTVERSLSALKRIKTYLRSTMGDERLSALAVIAINWEYAIDVEKVLDIMASTKSRRLIL